MTIQMYGIKQNIVNLLNLYQNLDIFCGGEGGFQIAY